MEKLPVIQPNSNEDIEEFDTILAKPYYQSSNFRFFNFDESNQKDGQRDDSEGESESHQNIQPSIIQRFMKFEASKSSDDEIEEKPIKLKAQSSSNSRSPPRVVKQSETGLTIRSRFINDSDNLSSIKSYRDSLHSNAESNISEDFVKISHNESNLTKAEQKRMEKQLKLEQKMLEKERKQKEVEQRRLEKAKIREEKRQQKLEKEAKEAEERNKKKQEKIQRDLDKQKIENEMEYARNQLKEKVDIKRQRMEEKKQLMEEKKKLLEEKRREKEEQRRVKDEQRRLKEEQRMLKMNEKKEKEERRKLILQEEQRRLDKSMNQDFIHSDKLVDQDPFEQKAADKTFYNEYNDDFENFFVHQPKEFKPLHRENYAGDLESMREQVYKSFQPQINNVSDRNDADFLFWNQPNQNKIQEIPNSSSIRNEPRPIDNSFWVPSKPLPNLNFEHKMEKADNYVETEDPLGSILNSWVEKFKLNRNDPKPQPSFLNLSWPAKAEFEHSPHHLVGEEFEPESLVIKPIEEHKSKPLKSPIFIIRIIRFILGASSTFVFSDS